MLTKARDGGRGFGFLESVYEKCLLIELRKAGLKAESQEAITVYYENQIVGDFVADIIVEDSVILELKSVRILAKVHEAQLVNYLVAIDFQIINFTRLEGGRGISHTSTTDNAVKLII